MTFIRTDTFLKLIPLASLLLTACTLTGQIGGPLTKITSPEWQQHEKQVEALTQYQARGSFAYINDRQKVYARFFWQQDEPERYRLVLTNPLGNTVMELNVQPGVVQLTDDKGQRYVSDDAEKTIQDMTGMNIPLNNMRKWMLGLPAGAQNFTLTSDARLKKISLIKGGELWVVDYKAYSSNSKPALPSLLEITHGDDRIKLKMDNWTFQ